MDEARLKLRALLDAGIRTVLSLQPDDETNGEGESFAPYEPILKQMATADGTEVSCVRRPVVDCDVPTPAEMAVILDTIDASIADSRPVYVHCWGGHGRTATVVGCWLVRQGRSGDEALAQVTTLRRHDSYLCNYPAPHCDAQIQFIRDWTRFDPAIADEHGKPDRSDADGAC